jgi:hypothetical protein
MSTRVIANTSRGIVTDRILACDGARSAERRRIKVYRLTAAGRRQLTQEAEAWRAFSAAINFVIRATPDAANSRVVRLLRILHFRGRVEQAMDNELRHYLECEIAERIGAAMSPDEARRIALRDFGGVEATKEEPATPHEPVDPATFAG